MSFKAKRWTVGPRGGDRRKMPTECGDCVAFTSCRPGACSQPYGCESWVDHDGRRALPDSVDDLDEDQGEKEEDNSSGFTFETIGGLVKGRCGDPEPEAVNPCDRCEHGAESCAGCEHATTKLTPYVDPPPPFIPEAMGDRQGVLPMPDAGPLFAVPDRKEGRS